MKRWWLLLLLGLMPHIAAAEPLKPFVSGAMAQIKAAMKEKPLIVSFWSIDCPPCYKELALWKRLSARYPALALVLVSTDERELAADVKQVLAEQGVAHLQNWQFAATQVQRLRYEIDSNWYGELPRTYFFSPDGDSAAVSGIIDCDNVEQWLAQYYPASN